MNALFLFVIVFLRKKGFSNNKSSYKLMVSNNEDFSPTLDGMQYTQTGFHYLYAQNVVFNKH